MDWLDRLKPIGRDVNFTPGRLRTPAPRALSLITLHSGLEVGAAAADRPGNSSSGQNSSKSHIHRYKLTNAYAVLDAAIFHLAYLGHLRKPAFVRLGRRLDDGD